MSTTEVLPKLQRRLYDLEKACWDADLFARGLRRLGRRRQGGAIATLTQRLDPRGFKLHSIHPPRTFEQAQPWLWRFWLKVPNRGEMVIFDHCWYSRVLVERVEKLIPETHGGTPTATSSISSACWPTTAPSS